MSDTVLGLIAKPQPIDVLGELGRWQGLYKGQADTALTNAQAGTASAQNQLAQLELAKKGFINQQVGFPVPQGLPGVQYQGQAGGALGGVAGGPGGGGGGGPQGGAAPAFPGEVGARMFGVAMPPMVAYGVASSDNPGQALKTAGETARNTIFSALSSAPADQTGAAVAYLYQSGWLTPQQAQQAMQDLPAFRSRMMMATQTPEGAQGAQTAAMGANLTYDANGRLVVNPTVVQGRRQGAAATAGGAAEGDMPFVEPRAEAGARGAATGSNATIDITVRNPDGTFSVRRMLSGEAADLIRTRPQEYRATSAADFFNPNVQISPEVWVARNTRSENAGGTADARNPMSSAMGNGQFLRDTWLPQVKKAAPGWAAGMTDEQILAQRANPARDAEMQWAYAQSNARDLAAKGVHVDASTLGLAHYLGPSGAAKVLSAAPNTPVSRLLPEDVLKANPNLRGMTVGQLHSWTISKFGTNTIDTSAPWRAGARPAPEAPPGAVPPPVAPGGAQAPAAGAAVPPPVAPSPAGQGAGQFSPQQQVQVTRDEQALTGDQAVAQQAFNMGNAAQASQIKLQQMRELAPVIPTGSGGDTRAAIAKWLETYMPEAAQKFTAAVSAGLIDPKSTAAADEYRKLMVQAMGEQAKANNPAGGLGVSEIYLTAFPGLETSRVAIPQMLNVMMMQNQRNIDYAQGAQAFYNDARQRFTANPLGGYPTMQAYNETFSRMASPEVYAAAAAALNLVPPSQWTKGLSPDQQKAAIAAAWRAQPNALLVGMDGRSQVSNPLLRRPQ